MFKEQQTVEFRRPMSSLFLFSKQGMECTPASNNLSPHSPRPYTDANSTHLGAENKVENVCGGSKGSRFRW